MNLVKVVQLILLLKEALDDGKLSKEELLQIFTFLGGK